MLKTGLVSITFRQLAPTDIVGLVQQAGLHGIEWGGDVHVPHGDVESARNIRRLTENAGLQVAAYGSYYRAGETTDVRFQDVLQSAAALGAPTIRVWAGKQGSADADEAYRDRVAEDTRRIAELAANVNVRVAFEFHGNTLTDTTESAVDLLRRVHHPNLFSYWQPPRGWDEGRLEESLRTILPHLQNLHVFAWTDDGTRRPLAEGSERWQRLFRQLQGERLPPQCYAMLEFVRNDDPSQFLEDAATLKRLLA